ncbi:MAG TPA: hypothetical protein GXX14_00980 [Clostridiaceae bacterium]|nr:hypothetical protein [Clostridiaceae bacterium]
MNNIKAHMICHTHWDREWYLTREEFRVKLVRLIDKLLDIIENNPDYVSFMLDGQTIVLEDYLEIKPEKREQIKKALENVKIVCGPWYILPDELLVSGESHIRNYLIGQKILSDMGSSMQVGYLPDSFGHPQQMPQIIKGLGMDAMVFWRGTANFMENTEFYWASPHTGSKILCIHMPCGYGNSARLSGDPSVSNPRLLKMISTLRDRSTTRHVLLMNGSDHIIAQEDIVEIVKAFNESHENIKIELTTLEKFIEELKEELPELKTYTGEFRYGHRSMLLGGTLSSRMPIKQNNHIVQRNMEKYLEPILAWEHLSDGQSGMGDYLAFLWKRILENHAHDSICGCSIDAVHAEMMTRFECIKQIQNTLISDTWKRIEQIAGRSGKAADAQLMVFEPVQDRKPSYLEVDIDLDRILMQQVNYEKSIIEDYEDRIEHPPVPKALKIVDDEGREIEHVILSSGKAYYTDYLDESLPEVYKVNRLKVGLMLPGYDCGFHVLNVFRADEEKEKALSYVQNGEDNGIENSYYSISFEGDSFKVIDKKTGKVYQGVNRLVDKGDAGDEYSYSWPEHDSIYGLDPESAKVEKISTPVYQKLIVKGNLLLPEKLTEDRKKRSSNLVPSPVAITVTLLKDIDRIDFETEIENNSCDHRLQVEFPSGILTDESQAEHCFGIVKRKIDLDIPETWAEYPQSTHPAHGVIKLSDGNGSLSAITEGLPEYEAENVNGQSVLKITLLRCVGWLSRKDLITRAGHAGWEFETPDAQLIGKHTFKYSITYHKAEDEGRAYSLLTKSIYPSIAHQFRKSSGDVELAGNPLSFISGLPWDVRMSALKLSERGGSLILRLYSIAQEDRKVRLTLPEKAREVYRVNLAEKRISKIDIQDGTLNFVVEPAEIVTFELVLCV